MDISKVSISGEKVDQELKAGAPGLAHPLLSTKTPRFLPAHRQWAPSPVWHQYMVICFLYFDISRFRYEWNYSVSLLCLTFFI